MVVIHNRLLTTDVCFAIGAEYSRQSAELVQICGRLTIVNFLSIINAAKNVRQIVWLAEVRGYLTIAVVNVVINTTENARHVVLIRCSCRLLSLAKYLLLLVGRGQVLGNLTSDFSCKIVLFRIKVFLSAKNGVHVVNIVPIGGLLALVALIATLSVLRLLSANPEVLLAAWLLRVVVSVLFHFNDYKAVYLS